MKVEGAPSAALALFPLLGRANSSSEHYIKQQHHSQHRYNTANMNKNEDQGNIAGPATAMMVRYAPSIRYIELIDSEPLCTAQRESPQTNRTTSFGHAGEAQGGLRSLDALMDALQSSNQL